MKKIFSLYLILMFLSITLTFCNVNPANFVNYTDSGNHFSIKLPKDMQGTLKISQNGNRTIFNWGNPQDGPYVDVEYFPGNNNISLDEWSNKFDELIQKRMTIVSKVKVSTKNKITGYRYILKYKPRGLTLRIVLVKGNTLYYIFQYLYTTKNALQEINKSNYFLNNIEVYK